MTTPLCAGVPGRSVTTHGSTNPIDRMLGALRAVFVLPLLLAACSGSSDDLSDSGHRPSEPDRPLVIGAIPDQDTDRLQEIYGATAEYLSAELDLPVEFKPVTDYTAAVSQFRTGDLDLVWFGGLTGVQARNQTPGALPLVQRDIDDDFRSVFIASAGSGLAPIEDIAGLQALAGVTFTFGSQSSTSGYLMPASFLLQAGIDPTTGFAALPGFSGSHDQTIDLVESGSYSAGVLNEQVWVSRVEAGSVDTSRVHLLWRSPAYADYHWMLGPSAIEDFGDGFPQDVAQAFLDISPDQPAEARLLELFGAESFIPTAAEDYGEIEEVGRQLGLVHDR